MKLSNIKSIKVGSFKYKICSKKYLDEDLWGQICFGNARIRIQRREGNKKIKKNRILAILLHELIHAIDENVKFTKDKKSKENDIDLFALYVIDNIDKLANKSRNFNYFKEYVDKCEMDINRKKMTFEAIVKMLSDNKKLVKILTEVFN